MRGNPYGRRADLAAGLAEKAVLLKRGGAPGSVREGITTLLEALERESTSAEDTRKVWDAFVLAHKLHRNQLRSSGEPYITHPLEVAAILARQRMDVASVMTGLLHDTVEDTDATTILIAQRFGDEVAKLVDGVTKFSRLEMLRLALNREEVLAERPPYEVGYDASADAAAWAAAGGMRPRMTGGSANNKVPRTASDSENLRKLVLAMSTDIRVLLVKLTDRLHNMRTLRYVNSEGSRRRKAHETLTIYAPLADRLGMSRLCHELEDLAFKELQPEAYDFIIQQQQRLFYSGKLQEMVKEMHSVYIGNDGGEGEGEGGGSGAAAAAADEEGGGTGSIEIGADAVWTLGSSGTLLKELHVSRQSAYRIWRQSIDSGLSPSDMLLKDYFSLVLVTPSVPACYHVLGAVHSRCRSFGEMRDYISTPKPNHYQSLHTTVIGPQQQMVGLMIRTSEMHLLAELGVVSLWQGELEYPWRSAHEYHSGWISSLRGVAESAASPDDFMELTQMELFPDQVFCLTPKGDTIRLPKGGTPLDFAYAIHSKIGSKCTRALVNGKPQPIFYSLNNGDLVEIVTSPNQVPSDEWEEIVVTGRARAEIRRSLNARRRQASEMAGRRLVQRALSATQLTGTSEVELLRAARAVPNSPRQLNLTDVYLNVAHGKIPIRKLIAVLRRNAARADRSKRQRGGLGTGGAESAGAVSWTEEAEAVAKAEEMVEAVVEAGEPLEVNNGFSRPLLDDLQAKVDFKFLDGQGRWEVQLAARLADGSGGALGSLAREVLASGGVVLAYNVRERSGTSVWADVTVELDEPHQLQELLISLRSLPHVERVRKLRAKRRDRRLRSRNQAVPPPVVQPLRATGDALEDLADLEVWNEEEDEEEEEDDEEDEGNIFRDI